MGGGGGGGLTLFLTIPALKFALEADMPATRYLNLSDGLFILATLIVSVNLAISVLSHSWAFEGFGERAVEFEKFSKYFSPLLGAAALGVILFLTSGSISHCLNLSAAKEKINDLYRGQLVTLTVSKQYLNRFGANVEFFSVSNCLIITLI